MSIVGDSQLPQIAPPQRILMGPGPSDVPARVYEALAMPTLGHLDPAYLEIMDLSSKAMRRVFKTENKLTMAVSGTGSAGMEACIANLIERGDEMILCLGGYFSMRMLEMAERYGAVVHKIEVDWGESIDPAQVEATLKAHPKTKVVGIVHGETSTGNLQPLEEISRLTHEAGALFMVDTVPTLGGEAVEVDAWGIDACYSGSQKSLSCPPGLAPVTFSDAAVECMQKRKTKVGSWYLDMTLICQYWGGERTYHHTAPVNMNYALYEGMRIVLEEGVDARVARHQRNHRALRAGLEALGLRYIPKRSMHVLNAVKVPEGVPDARIRQRLLHEYGIEIGAGLGPFKGQAWRIGIMGESGKKRNVLLVLAALETLLSEEGVSVAKGEALAAASAAYSA